MGGAAFKAGACQSQFESEDQRESSIHVYFAGNSGEEKRF